MREMKDSGIAWIGAIPNHWKVSKIKQIVCWKSVKGQPDLPVLSLYRDYGVVPKDSRDDNHNVTSLDTSGYKVVERGDLVINKMKAWQGSLAVSEYNGIVSPAYHICKITSEKICKKYLHYLLRDASYLPEYMRLSTGLRVGQWDLSFDDFKNIPFLVPPLAEQDRIAAFLDAECAEIDAVLEKTRASIEEYKKLKQAVITQAVTKGVRGDRPMKDSGIEWIGEIPAEWDVLNLVAHTSMLTPMRDRPENLDGPIPWVRIEDFEGKYIESSKAGLGVSMKTVKEMNLKVYPVGTILCTSSCIMGKCAIVSRELVSNQRFIGIIPDRTTDKTYLYYLMTSNAERMNFLSTGALQANLSRSAFEHLKVQFPPYSEQQEIVAYLDDKCEKIDALIARKQQYLTEIENYKKSLIYEYVTGKKEVV